MLIPVLLFIVGLACLIKGGDWFVDGASAIAEKFRRRDGRIDRNDAPRGYGIGVIGRVRTRRDRIR